MLDLSCALGRVKKPKKSRGILAICFFVDLIYIKTGKNKIQQISNFSSSKNCIFLRPKIQRIFKIYKGKILSTRISIFFYF